MGDADVGAGRAVYWYLSSIGTFAQAILPKIHIGARGECD